MTALITLTDDTYSANSADGRKRLYATVSLTNPYTATGEVITNTYFNTCLDGGRVIMVNPWVAVNSAGIASTGTVRGDNKSTSSFILQFFNSITTQIAGFVDNTVANLNQVTCFVELIGR
jgi:hypothetical protein